MQWCNLASQDVSDPVVSFQRKLLTSNVLDTSRHRDVKLLFSSPWGWAAESQWENMIIGKQLGKRGTTNDNNTHLLPTASRKVCRMCECEIGTKSPSPNWQNLLKLFDPLELADPQKGSLCKKFHCISANFEVDEILFHLSRWNWRLVSSPFQFFPFYTWLCCRAFFPVSFRPVCCWLDLFSCAWRPRGLKIGCQLLKVISFLHFFSWCSIGMTFSFPVLIF